MTDVRQPSKLRSLWPLAIAGLFMLTGILILVYLGRDTARLMNAPLDDIDLKALLSTDPAPTIESIRGKIVVLHFWGTWCGPCKEEFPKFVEVYRHYESDPNVMFISVSCSPGMENDLVELRNETSSYLQSLGVTMPTFADPAMFTRGKIARMLASGGFVYPFTLVTDREGFVREYWLGSSPNTMTELEAVITQLADKK